MPVEVESGVRFHRLVSAIFVASLTTCAQSPPPQPTWQAEIARNFVPYHQLTVADFSIDDKAHPDTSFWISPFIHYYYRALAKSSRGGVVYAYVTDWTIFSGLNKNETSRRSRAANIKNELPYAQALLDLNEIHARQMAVLSPGEFPAGKGDSVAAAQADLETHLKAFWQDRSKPFDAEQDALVKKTRRGEDKKKVAELGASIRRRLDAMPATAVPSASPTAAPVSLTSPTLSPR